MTLPDEVDYRVVTVDSGASTVMVGHPGESGWGKGLFEETLYGLAYRAKSNPKQVLVIGTGGGIDVQAALHHDNLGAVDNPSNELLVVHFANLLAKNIFDDQPTLAKIKVEDAESAHLLEIAPEIIVEIEDQVSSRMQILGASFS